MTDVSDLAVKGTGFDAIAHADPTPLILVTAAGCVVKANPAAKQDFGVESGTALFDIVHEAEADFARFLVRASGSREAIPAAFRLKASDGGLVHCRCLASLAQPGESKSSTLLIIRVLPQETASRAFFALTETVERLNREVHERRRVQDALEQSVREKEALLQELHHRVRNNLQLLLSMLAMRKGRGGESLAEFRDRIYAIAAVQELLHEASSLVEVDAARLVEQLCAGLQEGAAPPHVTITADADNVSLDPDRAVALGLVVNELVTNALKHAFPGQRTGEISVRLHQENGRVTLLVSDNGVGLIGSEPKTGLGGKIVGAMARNLDAEVSRFGESGTSVVLRFPAGAPE